jgi:hypothetical protein
MKTLGRNALIKSLLAAGMTQDQVDKTLAESETESEQPTAEEVAQLIKSLEKGGKIKKGELKIEHESEDDDGEDEEYDEVEAEDDDEAEEEMARRKTAKAITKSLVAGDVEQVIDGLLQANAKMHKSLLHERRELMREVKALRKSLATDALKAVSERLGEVERGLGEIKKGIMTPEAPRGMSGALPTKHPADAPPEKPKSDGWTYDTFTTALRKSLGRMTEAQRESATSLLFNVRSGGVTADAAARALGLNLADAA